MKNATLTSCFKAWVVAPHHTLLHLIPLPHMACLAQTSTLLILSNYFLILISNAYENSLNKPNCKAGTESMKETFSHCQVSHKAQEELTNKRSVTKNAPYKKSYVPTDGFWEWFRISGRRITNLTYDTADIALTTLTTGLGWISTRQEYKQAPETNGGNRSTVSVTLIMRMAQWCITVLQMTQSKFISCLSIFF